MTDPIDSSAAAQHPLSVSVVIPSYRRLDRIADLVRAYRAQGADQVVVVLDGPHPGWEHAVAPVAGPDLDVVAIGDLYADSPDDATPAWAEAVDLALGLTTVTTKILSSSGPVTRDELEAFHQRLLGVLHG